MEMIDGFYSKRDTLRGNYISNGNWLKNRDRHQKQR